MQSVMLVVPGRKTDIQDAEWLCQLVEAGLLRASFVPPQADPAAADLTRYRKTQIRERAREVQPAAQGAGGRRDQARLRRLRHPRQVRARRCSTRSCRARLTPRCSPSSRRAGCGQDPRAHEALEGRFERPSRARGSARSSRTSTSSTSRSPGSPTRSRSRSPLSRPRVKLLCTITGVAAPHRRGDDRRDRRRHEPCSRPHGTSPPGPDCAPATTSPPANAAPERPAKAPSGWTGRSRKPRSPRSAPRTPTSHAQYQRLRPRRGHRKRSARSSTRSSSALLAHAHHRRDLPRTRRRLLHPLSQAGFRGGFESRTICPRDQENLRGCHDHGSTHRS